MGCVFDDPDRNYIKIRNGAFVAKTGYPGTDFEVSISEIKKLRRNLHLDAKSGVDARGFYDLESNVNRFVESHVNLMRRLADL